MIGVAYIQVEVALISNSPTMILSDNIINEVTNVSTFGATLDQHPTSQIKMENYKID